MTGPSMASVSSPSEPDGRRCRPLEAIGVSKRYRGGAPWALRDVDLAIPRGSITALVGPNGAGKSTLIRSWVGFETPNSGTVRVLGVDPQRDRAAAIERLGYVSQTTGAVSRPVGGRPPCAGRDAPQGLRRGPRAAGGWSSWPSRSPSAPARSRAARRPRSPCVSRSAPGRRCCCSTSPWRRSTRWRATTS